MAPGSVATRSVWVLSPTCTVVIAESLLNTISPENAGASGAGTAGCTLTSSRATV
jgi:hypothetical protein